MPNRAAVLAFLVPLLPSVAQADEVTTQTANTVVVVTPNAPVVVSSGAPAALAQAPVQPAVDPEIAAPGMQAPPLPPPPPQNEDWNNVSHINGVPVKVGERGDYLYKYKKINIAADPFGVFLNYYDVAVSVGVSRNVAITGSFTGVSSDGSMEYQFAVSAPIYFRRTFSGPFLEPGLVAGNMFCSGCMTNTGPEMMFGWHWNFDSGLNAAVALGMEKNVSNSDGSNDVLPAGYFRVGYNF
jgi:hypothetical protein